MDSDGSVYFLARFSEIPGLVTDGETREEALLKLDETFDDWVEMLIDNGDEVPEPDLWPASTGLPLQGSLPIALRQAPGSFSYARNPEPWTGVPAKPQTVGAGV
jgi:predicted RNase H-like HicB family nuclease